MRKRDRALVASAVFAGVLIGVLLVSLWVTSSGGALPGTLRVPLDSVPEAQARERAISAVTDSARQGMIYNTAARITERLARDSVPRRPLTGPIRFRVRNAVWSGPDGPLFARAPALSGTLDAGALRRGDIIARGVVVEGADVRLSQTRTGGLWNYERVFEKLLSGDGGSGGGAARRFQLAGVRIANARVDVQRPEERMQFQALDAQLGSVVFSGPGVSDPTVDVDRIATTLYLPDRDDARLALTGADADLRIIEGGVDYTIAALSIDGTRLADVTGVWSVELPGYGVRARGRALDVRFADLRFLAPERIPEEGTASFTFDVDPIAEGRTRIALRELEAVSGESRASGSVDAVLLASGIELEAADLRVDPLSLALVEQLSGRTLPYGGTVAGTVRGTGGEIDFDLDARLTGGDAVLLTNLTGAVQFGADGFTLRNLTARFDNTPLAALRAIVPGIPFDGTLTGSVQLSGAPDRSPLDVDVRLELGSGVFSVAGVLDLRGAQPTYDLEGRVLGISLEEILAPRAPPALLTGRFSLVGRGFDPATLAARVDFDGRFTGWRAGTDDIVRVAAVVENGAVRVDDMEARLSTAALVAAGEWRFVEPREGAVTYRLDVSSLVPWGPYVPLSDDSTASGVLAAEGTVTGALGDVRLEGTAGGRDVRLGSGWHAQALDARYNARFGEAVPRVILAASVTELETPTAGDYDVIRADLRLTPPTFELDLTGDRTGGGVIELAADGDVPYAGERAIVLRRARLDLEDGSWQLDRPSTLAWGGDDGLRVSNMVFADSAGEGQIALDGRILPIDRLEIDVDIARLPIDELQELLGREPVAAGLLWTSGTLGSADGRLLADLEFRLDSGTVATVGMQNLAGTITLQPGQMVAQAEAVFDTAGTLDVELRLPLDVLLTDSLRARTLAGQWAVLREAGEVYGRVRADQVLLAPFDELTREVRDLTGRVEGEIRLDGTVQDPQYGGQLALVDAAAYVPAVQQEFDQINGAVSLAGRRITVDALRARSAGGGTVDVNGTVTFVELTEPILDLVATMDNFKPFGVEVHDDAQVTGRLDVEGPLVALVLQGDLSVADGFVAIPDFGGPGIDEDVLLGGPPLDGELEIRPSIYDNLTIRNLRVDVDPSTWFLIDEQSRAQAGGVLAIEKTGEDLSIVGTLEGERGTYVLAAGPILRRFDVLYANIQFRGMVPPQPLIEITAAHTIIDQSGRPVDIQVTIGGTLDEPTLALGSGSNATLPQSELLSFLFFGRPSFELGGAVSAGGVLGETYFGGLTEFLSLELEHELAQAGLGLDLFQLRLGGGPFGGGTTSIVVGREIANDVFLTAEAFLDGLTGAETSGASTWALRLEWAFDRRSSLIAGLEPVTNALLWRGGGLTTPLTSPRQQFLLEVRRRWVY